jgi:hypothetical protein
MMPNKTDRHDAIGLAQIVRTGWYKEVRIKSHGAYVIRALLTARDALVGIRVRLENEIRGLLKTFGVMFGKRVGGFMRRAEEIVAEELTLRMRPWAAPPAGPGRQRPSTACLMRRNDPGSALEGRHLGYVGLY